MHITQKDRDRFSKQYFYPETIMNYVQIFVEISRLCKIRSIQHKVLTNVEQREVYIKRLKEIGRQISGSIGNKGLLDNPIVTNEVPSIIANLRNVSVELVEAIVIWRVSEHFLVYFLTIIQECAIQEGIFHVERTKLYT